MNDYNFWADLLDTFQSAPDVIKALWLVLVLALPPAFVLGLIALVLHYRIARRAPPSPPGATYTILRDGEHPVEVVAPDPRYRLSDR